MFKWRLQQWSVIALKRGHNCCSGKRSKLLASAVWLGAVAFVLIGALEHFGWAVHQPEDGGGSRTHGPGLSCQAAQYSYLWHPALWDKGKNMVFPSFFLILKKQFPPRVSSEFLCCESMFERSQTKRNGKCLLSVLVQCLVILLCFRQGCCLC